MKRMLINATQPEELRVAIVDGQKLFNLDIETAGREQKKANIYKGRVTRVEPSLEAAFVEYGSERHGFLPLKEISRHYFTDSARESGGRVQIKDAIKEGQEVVVQIEKEERGNKGAALTTFISLAGRYLVLMPNNPRAGGISRRIEGQERNDLRDAMSGLEIPDGSGLIVRTAGIGKSQEDLQWDLNYLLQLWSAIESSAKEKAAPFLIYQESNVIIRSIRDHLRQDIGEIVIDHEEVYQEACEFIEQVMPHNLRKVRHYTDEVPLFSRYQIESQIESAFQREVRLPSGGAIVIDHTEALTSVDINSARSTKGADIEETALNTNLEAADEIARQLRMRDMGGLFVIDFIDMTPTRNQREVENRLKEAMKQDRARVQLGRISRFGLLELSRQRLRPSLGESMLHVCPRCDGHGFIRGVESLALSVLRIIEEHAMKENTLRINAQLPVDVATFLLNEKRQMIHDIEQRQNVSVVLIPNIHFDTPHYEIERVRDQDVNEDEEEVASYKMMAEPEDKKPDFAKPGDATPEEPTVKRFIPSSPAPTPQAKTPVAEVQPREKGFFSKLWKAIIGGDSAEQATEQPAKPVKRESPKRAESKGRDKRTRSSQDDNKRSNTNRPNKPKQANRKKSDDTRAQSTPRQEDKTAVKQTENREETKTSQEQKPENLVNKPANEQASGNEEPKRSSRRGRRGGRRRRKTNTGENESANQVSTENQEKAPETAENQSADAGEQSTSKPRASRSQSARKPRNSDEPNRMEKQEAVAEKSSDSKPEQSQSPAQPVDKVAPAAAKPVEKVERPSEAPASSSNAIASPSQTHKAETAKSATEKPAPVPEKQEAPSTQSAAISQQTKPTPATKAAEKPASSNEPVLRQVETKPTSAKPAETVSTQPKQVTEKPAASAPAKMPEQKPKPVPAQPLRQVETKPMAEKAPQPTPAPVATPKPAPTPVVKPESKPVSTQPLRQVETKPRMEPVSTGGAAAVKTAADTPKTAAPAAKPESAQKSTVEAERPKADVKSTPENKD
ncbi:ribonuclease E [Sedimenticola selenatireducens]|uniref:Ribonuclease E n=1 Tax=Sedimenticola selenatireducens TaxID=191960 RepID=A0A558DJV5_9GAMM|nr:ribonuclease E [Sedimenticola selenatireducens]TVT61254.1 MAG: ribonuclease E [Sedimenticola selenatireducens]